MNFIGFRPRCYRALTCHVDHDAIGTEVDGVIYGEVPLLRCPGLRLSVPFRNVSDPGCGKPLC
jgi:hypothetical protein